MTWPNIHNAEYVYDEDDPPGYLGAEARIDGKPLGVAAGGKQQAVRVFELPAGESLCPYHYEYSEEWLLVIDGDLTLRTPAGNEQITSGDLICFPIGPEGAHKVTAGEHGSTRFMMWSLRAEPDVSVYPDSDKIGVFTNNERDQFRFRRKDANVPYYEGEI